MEKIYYTKQNQKSGGCTSTIKMGLEKKYFGAGVEVVIENSVISLNSQNDDKVVIVSKLSSLGYSLTEELNLGLHKAKSVISCMVGRIIN